MKKQKELLFLIILICIILGGIIFLKIKNKVPIFNNCQIIIEEKEVRGDSMAPFIKNGTMIRILNSYQKCYVFRRNDLVIYKYAGHKTPLIKRIHAIPGDTLTLRKQQQGDWNIFINSKILQNKAGENYSFNDKEYQMLSLYAQDYPIIPKKTYLILGEKINGTMDSSRFGLIGEDNIIGKAEIVK